MRKCLFALCCVLFLLGSCSSHHGNKLLVVLTCGDTIYIHANSITADDGEVFFKDDVGTGYIADVEYIIPIPLDDEQD